MSTARTRQREQGKKIKYFDYSLLAVLIFLICFGLIMLYSTSYYEAAEKFSDSKYYFKRQLVIMLVSLVLMWIITKIDYHFYAPLAKFFFGFSIFLMALVQTPLGMELNGARRWIRMPANQQLQPSEVAKIAVIIFIPYIICKMGKKVLTLEGVGKVLAYGIFSAGCVFILTDNLSTAIIVFGITCAMIFVIHPKTAPFLGIIIAGFAAIFMGVWFIMKFMSDSDNFRIRRLLVWLQPENYAKGDGYQVLQALYAIGSGGFWGKGLGNSTQKLIIPEVQNDMIISVICEELGVFGAIVVLVLFGLLLYRILFIARNAPDLFGSLIATGVFAHIALQVILNIAVVSNLMPNTGITLPFISYGGTSVLFLMIEMGIVLGISRTIKFEE